MQKLIGKRFIWILIPVLFAMGYSIARFQLIKRELPVKTIVRKPEIPAKKEVKPVGEDKVFRTEAEWRQVLSPEQFRILRKKGTERAFSGDYHNHKGKGVYLCAACGNPLFKSEEKYDSGTGWPSFWTPIDDSAIGTSDDYSLFVKRIEVHCKVCGSHQGHVFDDGPQPTGKRYCINSAALKFVEQERKK